MLTSDESDISGTGSGASRIVVLTNGVGGLVGTEVGPEVGGDEGGAVVGDGVDHGFGAFVFLGLI